MGEMRAFVYNSNEEFELDGPVKPAHDPVCGEVLKGEGAFFCVGDGHSEIQGATKRVMSSFALKESEREPLSLTIEEFADLGAFLHQLDSFVEVSGSSVGLYVTSYEKVNKLFARNMSGTSCSPKGSCCGTHTSWRDPTGPTSTRYGSGWIRPPASSPTPWTQCSSSPPRPP